MSNPARDDGPEAVRAQRDLYLALLDLDEAVDVAGFLSRALTLITTATGAERGYIELQDPRAAEAPQHFTVRGADPAQTARFREAISGGVIAKALASGQPIVTASAVDDLRFRDRESVREQSIEAVLCVPIGTDPPIGVLYVQGRGGSGPFSSEDLALATLCARRIATVGDRLLLRDAERRARDHTVSVRRKVACSEIVGGSQALADLLEQMAVVAQLDVGVLLTGPTGSGKTVVARTLHENSRRRGGPFVALNCAAIPDTLLESELFGAIAGAHSTATRRLPGKVDAARGGTLLLDEVSELSMAAQAKLLQLLQAGEYFPLGSARGETADVRVVAATNVELSERVKAGRFREDLYYRLDVVRIAVPSLAQRADDVSTLAIAFARKACTRHALPQLVPSPGTLALVRALEWPGNVRQLEHALESAAIRAHGRGATAIEPGDLPESPRAGEALPTFQEATRGFQRDLVERTLVACDWNVAEAARRLDVARSYVYTLIKTFDIVRT